MPGQRRLPLEGGRVCGNQPVRADYLDTVVWDHITGLLADPAGHLGKIPGQKQDYLSDWP